MSLPPRVPGLPVIGNLLEFRRDPLAFFGRVTREFGDVARIKLGPLTPYLLGNPDLMADVLVGQPKLFRKDAFLRDLRSVLGNGLLTSEGDFWKRQRRLAQPPFHAKRVLGYGETFVEVTARAAAAWQDGQELDIHEEMMRVTLEIVGKTLFGADVGDAAQEVGESIEALLARTLDPVRTFLPQIDRLPLPRNARFREALAKLDAVVYGMISARRRSVADQAEGEDPHEDLLGMLMQARDDDGGRMSDVQLRDEVMTLFLAGHETTAIALSWTLYLISRNPAIEAELARSVRDKLGSRQPTAADLPDLKLVERVVMESMRLMPPAWSLGREATVDTTVGGYDVKAGTLLWMIPWAMHRDPRFFPEPLAFRPSRFEGDWQKHIPKHAYMPFGGGPRLCIGLSFAMLEATLMLATIVQKFSLTLVPGQRIVPMPGVTLRPKYGLRMRLHKR